MDESVLGAWKKGASLFNEGSFWEAHHEWETGWLNLEPKAKSRIQGLIQLCGVLYHLEKKHLSAAQSLCRNALEKLGEGRPAAPGIPDVEGAESYLKELLEALAAGDADVSVWLRKARSLTAEIGSAK